MRHLQPLLSICLLACAPLLATAQTLPALYAFTTSTTGTGDMHSWTEVADTTLDGLDAADGICRARAGAAGLPSPETFVAWLSDRDSDAYCRVFGLSGKKADRCGQSELPVGAGPWLRVDGVPFAGTIEQALDANRVYAPLNVDETGAAFFTSAESYTATDRDGTFAVKFGNNPDCEGWLTGQASGALGSTPALGSNLSSSGDWSFDGHGAGCNSRHRLTCMQQGRGAPLVGHARFGHREAFLTSVDVTGNLGGIAGADATCQSVAAAAHLFQPQSFKALLTSAAAGFGVAERFDNDGAWYRRDGLLFAHDKAELTGGAVTLPLNVTEFGDYVGISVALTGATQDGAPSGFDCGDWTTSSSARASGALANAIAFVSNGRNWLSPASVECAAPQPGDWSHKLFCLSDSDVIFHDELEDLPASP